MNEVKIKSHDRSLWHLDSEGRFVVEGVSPEQQQDKSPHGVQTLVVMADDSADTGRLFK